MQRCCATCGRLLSLGVFRLPDGDDPRTYLLPSKQLAETFFRLKPLNDARTQVCCPCCERVLAVGFEFPDEPFQLVFDERSTRQVRAGSAEAKLLDDLWLARERARAAGRGQRVVDLLEQTLVYSSDRFLALKAQTAAINDQLEAALQRLKAVAGRAFESVGALEPDSPLGCAPLRENSLKCLPRSQKES